MHSFYGEAFEEMLHMFYKPELGRGDRPGDEEYGVDADAMAPPHAGAVDPEEAACASVPVALARADDEGVNAPEVDAAAPDETKFYRRDARDCYMDSNGDLRCRQKVFLRFH